MIIMDLRSTMKVQDLEKIMNMGLRNTMTMDQRKVIAQDQEKIMNMGLRNTMTMDLKKVLTLQMSVEGMEQALGKRVRPLDLEKIMIIMGLRSTMTTQALEKTMIIMRKGLRKAQKKAQKREQRKVLKKDLQKTLRNP